MADIEKVINQLEIDYRDAEHRGWILVPVSRRTVKDALELLKSQQAEIERLKPKEGHWEVLTMCANEGIYCSECHMKIFDRTTKPKDRLSRYCPHCGSRNEQFFRDGEVVFR